MLGLGLLLLLVNSSGKELVVGLMGQEGEVVYRMASTKLNCIACFKSGWRKWERDFFFFCEAGWSLRRYLRALAD
jgi:hypothetical protein